MSSRARLLMLACLALAVLGRAPGFSGASFTSSTNNSLSSVSAASDWTPPTVAVSTPTGPVAGTTAVTATAADARSGVASVALEYAGTGSSTWVPLCTASTAPYQCSWNTTKVADGDYQLRATAFDNAGYTATALGSVRVDNTGPTVAITNPGSPLRGSQTLTATASDAGTGVRQVQLQYAKTGLTTWSTACTLTSAPYTCQLDTGSLPDGGYDFRAVATDAVGNTGISSTVQNLAVDNTATVSVQAPAYLGGTATVTANPTSTFGVGSVVLKYAAHGSTSFTNICPALTSAPYSCTWDTSRLPKGQYDVEAVLTDKAGLVLTSSVVTATVSSAAPAGASVQAANKAAGTAGTLEQGDTLTYTYTGLVDPSSLMTGWDGSAQNVTAQIEDGKVNGNNQNRDVIRVGNVNLGVVDTGADVVAMNTTVAVPATMTWAAVGDTTVVTITFGNVPPGKVASSSGAPVWTPSALAKSYAGTACSTASVTMPFGPEF